MHQVDNQYIVNSWCTVRKTLSNPSLVPSLQCINQVHALPSISLQDLFNILPSALNSSQCFCFFRRQPLKSCEHSFSAPYMPYVRPFSSSFSWLSEQYLVKIKIHDATNYAALFMLLLFPSSSAQTSSSTAHSRALSASVLPSIREVSFHIHIQISVKF